MKIKIKIKEWRFLLVSLALVLQVFVCRAFEFGNESLNYRVMYKWGLVNKQAGHATLSLRVNGSKYETRLVAASESWADHFFKVRDTLVGVVEQKGFRPVIYKKMSHEGSEHKHDEVSYSYFDNIVVGTCTRKKWDKEFRQVLNEERVLTARGTTVDMLSSFYYMRNRPYENWKTGHSEAISIFSGKRKEILTITYLGKKSIEVGNKRYNTYHISFTFTDPSKPKKQTSDPMDAWIWANDSRIPLKLEGKLKVGKVQCFYTGSN